MVQNIELKNVNSKFLHNLFLPEIIDKENHQYPRIFKYFNNEDNPNLESIFLICHNMSDEVRLKVFQFKFLHDILVNNYWLEKWKIKDSNL
jgi:hypothetical protein